MRRVLASRTGWIDCRSARPTSRGTTTATCSSTVIPELLRTPPRIRPSERFRGALNGWRRPLPLKACNCLGAALACCLAAAAFAHLARSSESWKTLERPWKSAKRVDRNRGCLAEVQRGEPHPRVSGMQFCRAVRGRRGWRGSAIHRGAWKWNCSTRTA